MAHSSYRASTNGKYVQISAYGLNDRSSRQPAWSNSKLKVSVLKIQSLFMDDDTPCYVKFRLRHGTPDHIHLTSRRRFIGPLSISWLKGNRRHWLKAFAVELGVLKAAMTHNTLCTKESGEHAVNGHSSEAPMSTNGTESPNHTEESNNVIDDTASESVASSNASRVRLEMSGEDATSSASVPTAQEDLSALGDSSSELSSTSPHESFETARPIRNGVSNPQFAGLDFDEHNSMISGVMDAHGISDNTSSGASLLPHEEPSSPPIRHANLTRNSFSSLIEQGRKNKSALGIVPFRTGDDECDEAMQLPDVDISLQKHFRPRAGGDDDGEVIRMERMLVRVEYSPSPDLGDTYDESKSEMIETRVLDKWREYVVVARRTRERDIPVVIHICKNRIIRATEKSVKRERFSRLIPISIKNTHANWYSTLDKSIVLWRPHPKKGTLIYLLRPRLVYSSTEWLAFVLRLLGRKPGPSVSIHVPDIGLSLALKIPRQFNYDESDLSSNFVRRRHRPLENVVIEAALESLEQNPEWSSIVKYWQNNARLGLAWRLHERLEWVFGANAANIRGQWTMGSSYGLELRPRIHYPTLVWPASQPPVTEPFPVEGFLVRLTPDNGGIRRFSDMFYKRLYFTTHDHLLCYCKPNRALVPLPQCAWNIDFDNPPSAEELSRIIPNIFNVEPLKAENNHFTWIGGKKNQNFHNMVAYNESERRLNVLLRVEVFTSLLNAKFRDSLT